MRIESLEERVALSISSPVEAAPAAALVSAAQFAPPQVRISIPLSDAYDHVYDPLREVLYVTTSQATVERYHLPTQSFLTPLHVGTTPHRLDISPDSNTLYVTERDPSAAQGFLWKFDLQAGGSTSLLYDRDFYEGGSTGVAIGADGKGLVTTQFKGSGWTPLRELDVASDTLTVRSDVPGGDVRGTLLEHSADRQFIFGFQSGTSAGPIFRYDVASDSFGHSTNTSAFIHDAAVNSDGSLVATQENSYLKIRNRDLGLVQSLGAMSVSSLGFDPIRDLLYVADSQSDQLLAYDAVSFAEVYRTPIGQDVERYGDMTITLDGQWLFVTAPSGLQAFQLGATEQPLARNDGYEVVLGVALDVPPSGGVLANDAVAGGNEATVAAVDLPRHGALTLAEDGSFRYTPDEGYIGQDWFSYRVAPGTESSALGYVTLNVGAEANLPPLAIADVFFGFAGAALVRQPDAGLLANDSDGDADALVVQLEQAPQQGQLNLQGDGSFTYTPAPGFQGSVSFTYRVSDGILASPAVRVDLHFLPAQSDVLIPATNSRDHIYDASRQVLYISAEHGKVERYDVVSGAMLPAWSIGTSLNGLDLTPDNGVLLVSDWNASGQGSDREGYLHWIDLQSGQTSSLAFPFPSYESYGSLDVSAGPDGHALVVAGNAQWRLDLATQHFEPANFLSYHEVPYSIYRSADRSYFFLYDSSSNSSIFAYDAVAKQLLHRADIYDYWRGAAAVNRDGTLVTMQLGFGEAAYMAVVDRNFDAVVNLKNIIGGVVFDPVRDILYGVDDQANLIRAFDTDSWQQLFTLPIGENVPEYSGNRVGRMSMSEDGRRLFLATPLGLRMFDLGTFAIDLPNAFAQQAATDEDVSLSLTLAGDDGDPQAEQPLQFAIVQQPAHGSLLGFDPATGQVVYVPDADFFGVDTFSFVAVRGSDSAETSVSLTATVTIDVQSVNDAPVGVDDVLVAPEDGVAIVLDVLANDSSGPDSGETLVLVEATPGDRGGQIEIASNGDYLRYTPAPNFVGEERFSYVVGDGTLTTTVQGTVRVTNPRNETVAVGTGPGQDPLLRVFDAETGLLLHERLAYDAGMGLGFRVAMGDVDGDGIADIVTAAGPGGGPHVRVFSGATFEPLAGALGSFLAYAPQFTGGVFVAVADFNADGHADIVAAADAGGGPHVRIFSGLDGSELGGFFAFATTFSGGVRLAVGDLDADGRPEIVTAAGPGGKPQIRVFRNLAGELWQGPGAEFDAYAGQFAGGVIVAAGDLTGDGRAEIITGAGAGGGPHVRAFHADGRLVADFLAYSPDFDGGVRVGVGDTNGDGQWDILTGAGIGGGPHLRGLTAQGLASLDAMVFDADFTGGIWLAGTTYPPLAAAQPSSAAFVADDTASALPMSTRQPEAVLAAALARWDGAEPDAFDRSGDATMFVAELSDELLLHVAGHRSGLDASAAEHGRRIDPTSLSDREFDVTDELLDSQSDPSFGVELPSLPAENMVALFVV